MEHALDTKTCQVCGEEFQPYVPWQIVCSKPPCRYSQRQDLCSQCGSIKRKTSALCRTCSLSNRSKAPCSKCGARRDIRGICRSCRTSVELKSRFKKRALLSSEEKKAIWRQQFFARIGLTEERYQELVIEQLGKCAICEEVPKVPLKADHDHVSGRFRGLICARCNQGLGLYHDNPERLIAAANYLMEFAADI